MADASLMQDLIQPLSYGLKEKFVMYKNIAKEMTVMRRTFFAIEKEGKNKTLYTGAIL